MITAPLLAVGRDLARKILTARTAACVNIVPGVESYYWWQGKLEKSREVLLVCKTTTSKLKALRRLVARHHTYEIPEFVALPLTEGSKKYLRWIDESLGES